MSSIVPPTPPSGTTAGMPGATVLPPGATPGKPGASSKTLSARPYIGRAIRLLGGHKLLTATTMILSLLVTLFPFIVSIAFSSIFQILGPLAGPGQSSTSNIWERTASLFGKTDVSSLGSLSWLATPLTLRTILIVWTCALVLSQLLSFLRSWIMAHLEARLLRTLQQSLYDHLQ